MEGQADGVQQAEADGTAPSAVRVLVSYAHDDAAHADRVRDFWWFLRAHGVDARLDRLAGEQRQDWPDWMAREVRDAAYILIIADPANAHWQKDLQIVQQRIADLPEDGGQ